MREFKEEVDYTYIIPSNEGTTVHLKLLTGPYVDTVYQYGKVKFDEEKNGDIYLRFVYNVVESPLEKAELEGSLDFKNYIGDILVNIMSQDANKGIIDEAGTSYIEESDL